jgi:hypothetical protein
MMCPVLLFHLCPVNERKVEKAEKVTKLIDGIFPFDFLLANVLPTRLRPYRAINSARGLLTVDVSFLISANLPIIVSIAAL